jgi:hypothetical protein
MAAQARQFVPVLTAVGRAEQCRVFDAGIDGIRVGQRGLEMPDALELPGMRRSVVPLMRPWNAVVDELVANWFPGFSAVVRALNELPEPSAAL